jgi:hypothetical protein
MSPAHARLASLASTMDNGGTRGSSGRGSSSMGLDHGDRVALEIPGVEAWQVSAEELAAGAEDFAFGGFDAGEEEDEEDGDDGGGWQPPTGLASLPGRSKERAAPIGGKWSKAEDCALKAIVQQHGPKNWKKVTSPRTTSSFSSCLFKRFCRLVYF